MFSMGPVLQNGLPWKLDMEYREEHVHLISALQWNDINTGPFRFVPASLSAEYCGEELNDCEVLASTRSGTGRQHPAASQKTRQKKNSKKEEIPAASVCGTGEVSGSDGEILR